MSRRVVLDGGGLITLSGADTCAGTRSADDCVNQPSCTLMHDNSAREGGGAVFDVVDTGWGALTLNEWYLHNNVSGEFQTFAGIYYDLDGNDRRPVMIRSTDRRQTARTVVGAGRLGRRRVPGATRWPAAAAQGWSARVRG